MGRIRRATVIQKQKVNPPKQKDFLQKITEETKTAKGKTPFAFPCCLKQKKTPGSKKVGDTLTHITDDTGGRAKMALLCFNTIFLASGHIFDL